MVTHDELVPEDRALLQAAAAAAEAAYSPYSGLRVGAILVGAEGERATGCNVENASFGLTICAERVALFKAVSEGHSRPVAAAVWTSAGHLLSPCGACRQVLHEFGPELRVVFGYTDPGGTLRGQVRTLAELLPDGFVSFGGPDAATDAAPDATQGSGRKR